MRAVCREMVGEMKGEGWRVYNMVRGNGGKGVT